MIKTAYSDKYKVLEEERLSRLREVTKEGSQYRKSRAKELSKETNRRRRALDERKKQREVEEAQEREAALAERRRQQQEATEKFQKGSSSRKKSSKTEINGTSDYQGQDSALPLQDGFHVIRGHVVEIKNGQRILTGTPALDDALNLVWGGSTPAGVQHGDNRLESHVHDEQKLWHQAGHYLDSPPLDNMEGVFFANNSLRHHSGKLNPSAANASANFSPLSFSPHEKAGLDDLARIAEHERLRQEAISKGGPKLAFMKDTNEQELTEGALPTTMGRDSPAGSLTSLDSLDEVPESESVSEGALIDKAKVSGIIVKSARGKSSGKRRVTFSDSIEFDDGVVGQLVTHQKQSTKYFTALYAKSVADNLQGVSSEGQASRHGSKSVTTAPKESASERTVALSRSQTRNTTTTSAMENSTGAVKGTPLVTQQSSEKSSAESLGFSVTHSNHPSECASRANAVLASSRSAGSAGLRAQPVVSTGDRGSDMQPTLSSQGDALNRYTSPQDSLEILRDSLDENSPEEALGDYARSMLGGRGQDIDHYSPEASQQKKQDFAEEGAQTVEGRTEVDELRNEGSSPTVTYHSNPFFHPAVPSATVSSVPSAQSRVTIPTSSTTPKSSSTHPGLSVAQDYSSTAFSDSSVATSVAPQNSHIPLSGVSAVENARHSSPVLMRTAFNAPQDSSVPLSGFSAVDNTHQSSPVATTAFNATQDSFTPSALSVFSVPPATTTTTTVIASSTRANPHQPLHTNGTRYQVSTDSAYTQHTRASAQPKVEVTSASDANHVKGSPQYPIRSFPSQRYPAPVVSDQASTTSKPSLHLPGSVASKQFSAVNQNSVRNGGLSDSSRGGNGEDRKKLNQAAVNGSRLSSAETKPPSRAAGPRNRPKAVRKTTEVNNSKPVSSQRSAVSKRVVNEQRTRTQAGFSNAEKSSTAKQARGVKSGMNDAGYVDSPSPSDEDEIINSIRWNMDRINMRARSDAAQSHHQKLMESLKADFDSRSGAWQEKEPSPDAFDKGEPLQNGLDPTRLRVGSATRRLHHPTPGRSLPMESRQAVGSASVKSAGTRVNSGRNVASHANPGVYSSPKTVTQGFDDKSGQSVFRNDYVGNTAAVSGGSYLSSHSNSNSSLSSWTAAPQVLEPTHRTSRPYGTMFVNPDAADTPAYSSVRENAFDQPNVHLKRSMALDRTPTDDEINFLWERVRTCLGTNTKQTAGSDSCVDTMHARRSRTHSGPMSRREVFQPSGSITRNSPLEDSHLAPNFSSVGGSTVGGLRRYGSHEVLRRNGSSDSFGLRRPALLQQRAQKSRQSQQGKPPLPRQHNQNFSPVHSRGTPSPSVTSKGPQPLSAHEMRAVMKASEQTQEMLQRGQQDHTPEQQYQHNLLSARKAPSALSLEEQRLMESLDRLNERLKVQEAVTSKLAQHNMNSRVANKPPTGQNRTGIHQRTSSASRANRKPQVTVPAPRNYSSTR